MEERDAANGPGGQEEDEELVGPLPPAPATPPQDCDSVDIDVGLDSASTGIQPMSVSAPGDCPLLCRSAGVPPAALPSPPCLTEQHCPCVPFRYYLSCKKAPPVRDFLSSSYGPLVHVEL